MHYIRIDRKLLSKCSSFYHKLTISCFISIKLISFETEYRLGYWVHQFYSVVLPLGYMRLHRFITAFISTVSCTCEPKLTENLAKVTNDEFISFAKFSSLYTFIPTSYIHISQLYLYLSLLKLGSVEFLLINIPDSKMNEGYTSKIRCICITTT